MRFLWHGDWRHSLQLYVLALGHNQTQALLLPELLSSERYSFSAWTTRCSEGAVGNLGRLLLGFGLISGYSLQLRLFFYAGLH